MTAPAFKIIARESGDIIEECDTLDDAVLQVSIYEENDIDNGDYTPDFYQIVREGAIVILARGEDETEVGAFTDLDEGREFAAYVKMRMEKVLQDCAHLKDYGHNPILVTREVYNAAGNLLIRDVEASA